MSETIFQFCKELTDFTKVKSRSYQEAERAVGFHRWFPNGPSDALSLETGHPNVSLRIWFDPKHISRGSFTTENEKEALALCDESALSKIGVLWSGPLFGELKVSGGLPENCIDALVQTSEEAIPEHQEIAKIILKYWICPSLEKFIHTLRFRFGHYWVAAFEGWDGDLDTLSSYCNGTFMLKVSTDAGRSFRALSLGPIILSGTGVFDMNGDSYRAYLSKLDWYKIPSHVKNFDDSSPALRVLLKVLCSAHHLLEAEDVKYALLESITALELAIDHRFRQGLKGGKAVLKKEVRFTGDQNGKGGLDLPSKIVIANAFACCASEKEVEDILEAINERNKLVHEGKDPREDVEKCVKTVLEYIVSILELEYRFVRHEAGNIKMDTAKWENRNEEERPKS